MWGSGVLIVVGVLEVEKDGIDYVLEMVLFLLFIFVRKEFEV